MRVFTKIWLIIWKNLLFRRHHFCITALEIILPTLVALQFAMFVRQGINAPRGGDGDYRDSHGHDSNEMKTVETLESEHLEKARKKFLEYEYYSSSHEFPKTILFVPKSAETVMTDVLTNLAKPEEPYDSSRIQGFDSEGDAKDFVKDFLTQHTYLQHSTDFPYRVLVVLENLGRGQGSSPRKGKVVSYKIRLIEHNTYRGVEEKDRLYTLPLAPGPGKYANAYHDSGFTGLQIALDKALITAFTGGEKPAVTINTMPMPYPSVKERKALTQNSIAGAVNVLLILGFIFIVPSVIRNVISEKESGIKELMKMMGLPNWMHWLGWMINSMMLFTLTSVIVTLFLFVPFSVVNGAVFNDASPTLFFVVLLLFGMATTALCFLISTFFQKPALGLTVGIVFYLVTYMGICIPIELNYFYLSFIVKLSCTLIPTLGLHLTIKHMGFLERIGGATWFNMFSGLDPTDKFSIGVICMMLIFDTVLYTALALYFENIIPSEYGLRKPFYYPFLIFKRHQSWGSVSPEPEEPEENRPGFEPEPTDLPAGVVIHNLRKEFGRHKVAVNMRGTLKMYDGQITALLGHNGAGKTTTLSILTGMFAPTSGTASVNGYDIRTDMDSVRMNLGLCPQHNMIFQKLTVKEHLLFFGRLKGLSKQQANDELQALLWKMHMLDKINTSAGKLSGGQKRRLCLAMALIGGTKVVILDEPTSGMDPEVRRAIWDLLLSMRGERTIVLTTHFMEEADVLGDRIAIMAEGEVKCCGTPSFLKKYYGAGYTLKLTVADPSVAVSVLELVQKTFPRASQKKDSSGNAAELDITIPTEADGNSKFPALFSALSSARDGLGIQTMGLSLATMDDIFIKVGEDVGIEEHEISNSFETNDESINSHRPTRLYLILMQFYAIFWKRMIYTLRNWKLIIAQFILPLGLTIMAILISHPFLYPTVDEGQPLSIDLAAYHNPVTLYTAATDDLASAYQRTVGKSAVRVKSLPIDVALLAAGKDDLEAYRQRYIVAGDLKADSCTAIFSTLPNHASPLSVNLMSNAILRSMTPGQGYRIKTAVHPFRIVQTYVSPREDNSDIGIQVGNLFGSLMTVGLALLVASYVVAPIEEKLCQVKQLQLMTGVNPALYWAATFLWDLLAIFLLTCLIIISFVVFQNNALFLANHGAGVLFLIVMFYGFAAVPFSYLFSTFGQSVSGMFAMIAVIHILPGIIVAPIVFKLGRFRNLSIFRGIMRIFPSFTASLGIMRFVHGAVLNAECRHFTKEYQQRHCDAGSNPEKQRCCPNCVDCFKLEPLMIWDTKHVLLDGTTVKIPGIGQDIFCLAVMGIVHLAILMVVELGLVKKLLSKAGQVDPSIFAQMGSGDYDVQWEKGRVSYLVANGQVGEDALVVDNLCKSYGSFAAVSGLSFGVHYGECFGLLGVNGAGKTTSFRMLTGDEIRSFGNAYSTGTSLETDRGGFLSLIGYCPQFDGLIGVLTGREMVDLFGRMRGIRRGQVKTESMKWLFKLGLQDSANVQCRKYSGGMKRRLCAAISLVGDPPIILLDEPTSGVDPIARRQFWKVIDSVKQTGQSVVLTSHSMEECEALCGRLGIMVNGQFQCMGGVQHLKTKFAMGYKLVVTLVAQAMHPEGAEQEAKPKEAEQEVKPKEVEQAVKPKGAEQAVKPKEAEQDLKPKTSKVSTKTEPKVEPMREPEQVEEAGHPDNAANLNEVRIKTKVSVSVPVEDDAETIMSEEELKISALCDEITNGFNPCFLRDRHQRVLEFQVTGVEVGWGEMFGRMEKIRGAHAQMIEDYSITETTLEEVFLAFARVQYPEREVNVPLCKKLVTCGCCK